MTDDRGARLPQLAVTVPTVESGLWQVLPDGRMETTFRLRPDARWHDGAPVTADDLVFTSSVLRDPRVPELRADAYDWIERVEALDAGSVVVSWSRPFIGADTLFSHELTPAFPKHLLEDAYRFDATNFAGLPYWREEYVGAGPYRVKDWALGSHVMLSAFEQYVLGRPRVDEIEVRFIPDGNARVAAVLAGAVDVVMGVGLSLEQGMLAGERWPDGKLAVEFNGNWTTLYPQFVDPTPPVIGDLRLRKSLMYGMDRQEMVESLQGGLVPVAHSFLAPNQPQYREIEARVVRYDYDPRKATELLEEVGFTKGPDGTLRDRANRQLSLEIRSTAGDVASKAMLAVASYWERLGVAVRTEVVPPQRSADFVYTAAFPSFYLSIPGADVRSLPDLYGSRARLASNSFRVPGQGNWSRYMNPEFDALLDKFFGTIPQRERTEALGLIIYHISDRLNLMGLFHNALPELIANRVVNTTPGRPPLPASTISWNAHQWDVR